MTTDAAAASSDSLWAILRKRPGPLTSVAFTVPIFLLYHLGILLVQRRSRADFVSAPMLKLLNASVPAYVMATLAVTLVFLLVAWIEQRRSAVSAGSLLRVLVEALACALLVLVSVGWTSHQLLHSPTPRALGGLGVFDKLVLAAGTGFHEELIFRVLLVSGGRLLITKAFSLGAKAALTLSIAISSLAFALAHNVGTGGEPFVLNVALYRVIEGVAFSMLYVVRGFAAAVYAHTFYEALVLFVYA